MRGYNTHGVDIFDEDWDNLIILDACRFDMFEELNTIDGDLMSVSSRGASTPEFLFANFHNRELLDTVYITANPKLHENRSRINTELHFVENVWETEWNDEEETVLPEAMTEAGIRASDRFDDKRLIIHYLQPHYPFLGDGPDLFDKEQAFRRPDEPGSWFQVMSGQLDVSAEDVWKQYKQTLSIALPHVERLVDSLHGKTVVTADHGNMVGERSSPIPIKEWGHPHGIYTPELVNVPWLVNETDDRRSISESPPITQESDVNQDVVQKRLESLGYK